jgi:hypothetical protein
MRPSPIGTRENRTADERLDDFGVNLHAGDACIERCGTHVAQTRGRRAYENDASLDLVLAHFVAQEPSERDEPVRLRRRVIRPDIGSRSGLYLAIADFQRVDSGLPSKGRLSAGIGGAHNDGAHALRNAQRLERKRGKQRAV